MLSILLLQLCLVYIKDVSITGGILNMYFRTLRSTEIVELNEKNLFVVRLCTCTWKKEEDIVGSCAKFLPSFSARMTE